MIFISGIAYEGKWVSINTFERIQDVHLI